MKSKRKNFIKMKKNDIASDTVVPLERPRMSMLRARLIIKDGGWHSTGN